MNSFVYMMTQLERVNRSNFGLILDFEKFFFYMFASINVSILESEFFKQDKNVAIDIDIDQYNLTENSAEISYKPDPTRIPKGLTHTRKR